MGEREDGERQEERASSTVVSVIDDTGLPCNIASTSIHRKTHLAVVGERDRRAALDGEHPERVLAGPIKTLKELACSRFGV